MQPQEVHAEQKSIAMASTKNSQCQYGARSCSKPRYTAQPHNFYGPWCGFHGHKHYDESNFDIRKSYNKDAHPSASNAQTSSIQIKTEDSSLESTSYVSVLLALMLNSRVQPTHFIIPLEDHTWKDFPQNTITAGGKCHAITHIGDVTISQGECNILTFPIIVVGPNIIKNLLSLH